MAKKKNLVEDFLIEKKIIDPNKFTHNYVHDDLEWFVYKISDTSIMYVNYDLVPHGIGLAFVIIIECSNLTYKINAKYYSKSFTNCTENDWDNIDEELKNRLLSETMMELNVWGNKDV